MSQAVAAVHEVREPSAKYLVQGAEQAQPLVQHFNLLATAPGGVARLRELILTLAVQGKLVPQDPSDEPASELLKKIRAEKDRLIAEGKIKRDKPLAEIAEDEKPFGLPRGWAWVRLNSLLQKIGAGSTPLGGREVYVSSGVKFLRSQNVWDDGLRMEGVAFIKPETHVKMSGTFVVANDLLFNITGASIGRCAVVPSDFDEANVSQHVTIVRTVLPALNSFLHKVLVSRHVQQAVMDVQVGVSREGLSIAKLGQFLIPVPPLAEQSRIVARVEELMRLCDALEAKGKLEAEQHARLVNTLLGTLTQSESPEALAESWQRVAAHFDLLLDRPEAVDALEQTILQLAVRGLLVPQDPNDEPASELLKKIRAEKDQLIAQGKIKRDKPLSSIAEDEKPFELPKGWEWVRLLDLMPEFQNGASSRGDAGGKSITVLRLADIKNKRISLAETRQIPIAPSDIEKYQLTQGDILITRVNGSADIVGQFNLCETPVEAIYCDHFIRMRIDRSWIAPEFCALLGESELVRASIKSLFITTAGQKTVNQGHIGSLSLPLPPLAEQSRIVTRVNELRRLCADLRQRLSAQQKLQTQLAEALVAG
jgi:type I restriction enzyme, S subunit